MTIRLEKNPYQGINAHLNSFLLDSGSWTSFHSAYIVALTDALNTVLPGGYYAVVEQSLQIQLPDEDSARSRPDMGILRQGTKTEAAIHTPMITPTPELPLTPLSLEDDQLTAIEIVDAHSGRLITRIELFSPKNKTLPRPYLQMRTRMLERGVHMVEIDTIHTLHSPFREALSDYTRHETGAYPYRNRAPTPLNLLMGKKERP